MKKHYDNVKILAYYDLDGDYMTFPYNPLHNKTFSNVNVEIKKRKVTYFGMEFIEDVIEIEGEEPIDCELIGKKVSNGTLILEICQDAG